MKLMIFLCRILSVLFLFFSTNVAFAENRTSAVEAAESGLTLMLKSIPHGLEKRYGFANRDEFISATVGSPYQMYSIPPETFFGSAEITDDMFKPSEEWRFPVVCDGRIRALLTVAKINDKWQAVDIGAAQLASEIDIIEKSLPTKAPGARRILLRLYQIRSDFILIADSSSNLVNGNYYPLKSALQGNGVLKALSSTVTALSFQELFPSLKERFRNEYIPTK